MYRIRRRTRRHPPPSAKYRNSTPHSFHIQENKIYIYELYENYPNLRNKKKRFKFSISNPILCIRYIQFNFEKETFESPNKKKGRKNHSISSTKKHIFKTELNREKN